MNNFIELNQKEIAIVSGGCEGCYITIPLTLLVAVATISICFACELEDKTKYKQNHAYHHYKRVFKTLSKKRHALLFGALTGTLAAAVVGCTLGAFLS